MNTIIFFSFFTIVSAWPFERPYFEDYDNYPRGGYGRPQNNYEGYGRPPYIHPDQFQIQTDYMRPIGGYGRPQNVYPSSNPNFGNNYPSQPSFGNSEPNPWDRPVPNPTTFGNRFGNSNLDSQSGMTGQFAVEPATKVAEGVVNTGSQIDTTGIQTFDTSSATTDARSDQISNGKLTGMNGNNNSGMDGTPSSGFGSSSVGLFGGAPSGAGTIEPSTLSSETPKINPAATADGALVLG